MTASSPNRTTITFPFEPSFFWIGALILVLMGLVAVIVMIALLVNGQWLGAVIALPGLGVFIGCGSYFFFRHRGAVVLTPDRLLVVRGGKTRKQVLYTDITGSVQFDRHLPPSLTLHTNTESVRFSGKLLAFPWFYAELCRRCPRLALDNELTLPVELDARPHMRREILGAGAVLGLLLYGIMFGTMLAHGQSNWLEATSIITTIWLFMTGVAALSVIRPGYPAWVRIETNDREVVVHARSLWGRETHIPGSSLEFVTIRESVEEVGEVAAKKRTYPIVFQGSKAGDKKPERIAIDEVLARALGLRTAALFESLRKTLQQSGVSVVEYRQPGR